MAYEPTNWKAGDTVTSAKLNKIEQGIAGGANILIINEVPEDDLLVLDKTWQEINNAEIAFVIQPFQLGKRITAVTEVSHYDDIYRIVVS